MLELTGSNGFLQVLDGLLLAAEASALLVVKPTQLLKDLGVIGIAFENARVCRLGRVVLWKISGMPWWQHGVTTYVFLLFMHVSDLEPNVLLAERLWRVRHYIAEALWSCQSAGQYGRQRCRLTSRLCWNFCCCLYIMPSLK
jgi:hypothetical protein